jgi:hypothetical protein
MDKLRAIFSSFRVKVTITLILSLFFAAGLSNFLIYKFSLDSQLDQFREGLKAVARTSALMVDPDGIKGDNTDILAQIVTAADSYDAMTSARAYRRSLTKEAAMEELKKNSGTQFNPKIVDVFLEVLKEEGKG